MNIRVLAATLLSTPLLAAPVPAAPPTFQVSFDASTRPDPATGRLIIYLIKDGSKVGPDTAPSDGPFWEDPQPLFGIDVNNLAAGATATVDDSATAFIGPPSRLEYGSYRAQAVLDIHQDDSNWHREPGNLFSDTVKFTVDRDGIAKPVTLKLTNTIKPEPLPNVDGVEYFEVRSKLLSDFHHRDIMLRAGVVLPKPYDPARSYAAVYAVPGFGGDHREAWQRGRARRTDAPGAVELQANAFWIALDPESGNGHTLFADSANNGPCGEALVKELIPALESKYHLIAKPEARLLRGHSSGGWSTLWLALTYPETFGACWSSSPDPVDFHRLQLVDIYRPTNFYFLPGVTAGPITDPELLHIEQLSAGLPGLRGPEGGLPIASTRGGGRATMSNYTENRGEEVLGPDNTSGQQWDSWFAVWGPRNERGHPAAIYDPSTGAIDPAIAEQYKKYDITQRLLADPAKLGPIFLDRIRLVVGDQDTFFLNEAVQLLKPEVEKINPPQTAPGHHGYIKIVPGADHGTIFQSAELRAFPQDMVDHLKRNNLLSASPAPAGG